MIRHMDIFSKYLSCKVEYIASSLYSTMMLWTAKLPSPLKNDRKQRAPADNKDDTQVGLKTLVHSEEKLPPPHPTHGHPSVVHCYTLAAASKTSPQPPASSSSLSLSSSSAFRSSVMDDLIGTESGDYMSSDAADQELKAEPPTTQSNKSSRARHTSAQTRQYPPPILLLTQPGNMPGRMPWVFRREYSDGRLVIRAERVRRHEYIEAHRENGRLTMRLVPVDDDDPDTVFCDECGHPIREEEEELEDLEFNEEPEELEAEEEEEEEGEDGDFDFEEGLAKEGSNLSQKSSLENESRRCGDIGMCVTDAGDGFAQDSDPLWKGNGIGGASGYLGRPGSASLRPMATVM